MSGPIEPREIDGGTLHLIQQRVARDVYVGTEESRAMIAHIEWLRLQEVSLHAELVTARSYEAIHQKQAEDAQAEVNRLVAQQITDLARIGETEAVLRDAPFNYYATGTASHDEYAAWLDKRRDLLLAPSVEADAKPSKAPRPKRSYCTDGKRTKPPTRPDPAGVVATCGQCNKVHDLGWCEESDAGPANGCPSDDEIDDVLEAAGHKWSSSVSAIVRRLIAHVKQPERQAVTIDEMNDGLAKEFSRPKSARTQELEQWGRDMEHQRDQLRDRITSIEHERDSAVAASRGEQQAPSFQAELRQIINRHCVDNKANTPDFILAHTISQIIDAVSDMVNKREYWHGRATMPSTGGVLSAPATEMKDG